MRTTLAVVISVALIVIALGIYVFFTVARQALNITYALDMARENPLLGIAGTDPTALTTAAENLEKTSAKLASFQKTPDEKKVIEHLYPISYLKALAIVETSRRSFLQSHSETDYKLYVQAQKKALMEGREHVLALQSIFKMESAESDSRIATAGGTFTISDMEIALMNIREKIDLLESELLRREMCVYGDAGQCRDADTISALTPLKPSTRLSPDQKKKAMEASELRMSASDSPSKKTSFVVLSDSTCANVIGGPQVFEPDDPRGPLFVGDLYFTRINPKGSTGPYISQQYGATYLPINPVVFYQCPDLLQDISRVRATVAVVLFAQDYPDVAREKRALLFEEEGTLYESDAIAYLHAAREQVDLSPDERGKLLSMEQMFTEGRAGLDTLVEQIVSVDERDLRIVTGGVPFDISARTMLLTHSAFPSLLWVGQPFQKSWNEERRAKFLSVYRPLSSLRSEVPIEKLRSDLRAFLLFERN